MRFKNGYRVLDFDRTSKTFRTLFHGVKGSRILPQGKFIKAEKRTVRDGKSTSYISGFHVFTDLDKCLKYAKSFGRRHKRAVVHIHFTGNRVKAHSPSKVILADRMRIPKEPGCCVPLAIFDQET